MNILEERVWAGSETSLKSAVDAEASMTVKLNAGHMDEETDDRGPRLLDVSDGLATIAIKGPLVNDDSEYLQYFGMTGYPEIREAMLAAANDPEVKQILLDVDSGGGAVSGCDDTAKLIRLVNDRVKPVTTYTDGNMCSAAYWLGSAAGEVYSGKASLVGSIGIIATFREYSEANKKEGIGVTVIRAGKHKALANSNEKLTPEARAQIQKVVDAAYEVFVESVADMRGKSYEYADKTMADGQEFIGQAAVDVGLTDGVTTFDALITDLKEKIVAIERKSMDNLGNGNKSLYGTTSTGDTPMAKKALTEADIAAMAAGAVVLDPQPAAAAEPVVIEGEASGVQKEGVEPQKEVAVVPVAAESTVVVEDDKTAATVQLLNSQLLAKDALILEAGIKTAKLQEQLVDAQATATPLLEIAAKSISNMMIALGGSAFVPGEMSAVAVLAEHTRVSAQFQAKFKAGGVAAVTGDAAETKTQVDPRHLARVNAARFQSKE